MDVNGISENLVGNASLPIYNWNLGLGLVKEETEITLPFSILIFSSFVNVKQNYR